MKKIILASSVLMASIICSCGKEDDEAPTQVQKVTLRYEFSADSVAEYNLQYDTDTLNPRPQGVTLSTNLWSKDTVLIKSDTVRVTRFTALPPSAWTGTALSSPITIQLFVDGDRKDSVSGVLSGYDRPIGISVIAAY